MRLAAKRVLVTGGGSGTGADIAKAFAAAGASVVIAGRRTEALENVAAANPSIRAVVADVTDEASVKALFAQAGACDIVIANAGNATSGSFARTSLSDWNAMLAVNLTGVFLTFREALARMEGWGRLIAIASTAGLKGYPYVAPYVAAKHGTVGLVRALALEVAARPVTVNAICPGFLDTEMTERSIATIMEKTKRGREEAVAALAKNNPQGRLFDASEVSAAALWLCSDAAKGVNGHALAISGGEV
jgi:3-hydroxybutyrate dehydrogenase